MSEQLLVRGLKPGTKARLRQRAEHHHRSMESEIRAMLEASLDSEFVSAADALADDRPEADFDWEPERIPMISRPIEF